MNELKISDKINNDDVDKLSTPDKIEVSGNIGVSKITIEQPSRRSSLIPPIHLMEKSSTSKVDGEENEWQYKQISFNDLLKIRNQMGIIDTSFPENTNQLEKEFSEFPKSYSTLTKKEKLLLLFTENFRQQYNEFYKHRRPLVLAPRNECEIQKFVCTTIRPTSFVFPELIGSWEKIASFVADHILYEPLQNAVAIPFHLISPDTLLKRRKGNSFEMATLLCSMLIGTGYAAYVVSGYASREVTMNNQSRVSCPFIPSEIKQNEIVETIIPNKYQLKEPLDLRSKFLLEEENKKLAKKKATQNEKLEEERRLIAIMEQLPEDEFEGLRVHAWVVVIDRFKSDSSQYPAAFFIEPSTGFRVEVDDPSYMGVESIWNQFNYYVNKQEPINKISEMRWRLSQPEDWIEFLPGESMDENDETESQKQMHILEESVSKEKSWTTPPRDKTLDIPVSWVERLQIALPDYDERFPGGEKFIIYKRATYKRFAPYKMSNGLVKELTIFETLEYDSPITCWQWYEKRVDFLTLIKIIHRQRKTVEFFKNGRLDCLIYHSCEILESDEIKDVFEFNHQPRLDCLERLEIHENLLQEFYHDRDDLLFFRKYKWKCSNRTSTINSDDLKNLLSIEEKFHRNPKLPAISDIAERTFNLANNKIFIQYHYEENCITASTIEFTKPPAPHYKQELIYNPDLTTSYNSNILNLNRSALEIYLLLLEQLRAEEVSKTQYSSRLDEIKKLKVSRKSETDFPSLAFSVFDPLRNDEARRLRLEKFEMMKAREEQLKRENPDFLASYLVKYPNKPLTFAQSTAAFCNCLEDLKSYFLEMLNELQSRYDELIKEGKSLKKFLLQYQDQFSDSDLDELIKEGESIDRNKKVIQNRIVKLKEESEWKYKEVKMQLIQDPRLNLNEPDEKSEIVENDEYMETDKIFFGKIYF